MLQGSSNRRLPCPPAQVRVPCIKQDFRRNGRLPFTFSAMAKTTPIKDGSSAFSSQPEQIKPLGHQSLAIYSRHAFSLPNQFSTPRNVSGQSMLDTAPWRFREHFLHLAAGCVKCPSTFYKTQLPRSKFSQKTAKESDHVWG